MLIPTMNRYELIEKLPKGGIVAEIGVWEGNLSQAILEQTEPSILYLIDSWGPTENPKYDFDPAYGSMDDGERCYRGILNKFEKEISIGQVQIVRSLSSKCLDMFPDNYFDWIYIDADHSYKGALTDLQLYAPKVKREGFILGHDYTQGAMYGWDFGVIEAVNDFVYANKFHFLALTLREGFPSFVISKIYEREADDLLSNIVNNSSFTLDIDNFVDYKFSHTILKGNGKDVVLAKLKKG